MLYGDWDIVLVGEHIRITPMLDTDNTAYTELMFGHLASTYREQMGKMPDSGLGKILSHEATDETHAIRLKDSPDFIGWITLQRDSEGRPDIGVSLVPSQRNKGYGSEAIALFVNYLHAQYGLTRIFARTYESNVPCRRALSKLGAIVDKVAPDENQVALLMRIYRDEPGRIKEAPNVYHHHIDLPVIIRDL